MPKHPFIVAERVRWGDIDLAGIIFYGAYVRFFEIAETEIFRAAGLPYGDVFERFDVWLPRKVVHAEFHAPALLDEELHVLTYFSRVGTTSLTINYDVMDAERRVLHAVAHQVLVCADRKTMTKRPLPPELVAAIEPYVMSTDEARTSGHA